MTTTNQTTLTDEHRDFVQAIDAALSSLETALSNEEKFRVRVHKDEPECDATLPALKFPIVLSSNPAKPFDLITAWRRDWAYKLIGGGE